VTDFSPLLPIPVFSGTLTRSNPFPLVLFCPIQKRQNRFLQRISKSKKRGFLGEVAARSFIERVSKSALQRPISVESDLDRAVDYAAEGIWYDTLSTLISASEKDPTNLALKTELRSLLTQAGQRQLELAHGVNSLSRR
jgi:hypothetical protein